QGGPTTAFKFRLTAPIADLVSFKTSCVALTVAALLSFWTAILGAERAGAASSPRARFAAEYLRPSKVPHPADNAPAPARDLLGRPLFFAPRLSGSNWISCASCHNPGFSWGDGLPRAVGHEMRTLGRRTPTILNLAWAESLFWDGRAGSLEEQ